MPSMDPGVATFVASIASEAGYQCEGLQIISSSSAIPPQWLQEAVKLVLQNLMCEQLVHIHT